MSVNFSGAEILRRKRKIRRVCQGLLLNVLRNRRRIEISRRSCPVAVKKIPKPLMHMQNRGFYCCRRHNIFNLLLS